MGEWKYFFLMYDYTNNVRSFDKWEFLSSDAYKRLNREAKKIFSPFTASLILA